MKKKEYTAYIKEHPLCVVAYTEKNTVTKASIASALECAHFEAPVPTDYEEEYAELEKARNLAVRSEETTKLVRGLEKALDEKCRERYATLTDDEIMDLLVNRKWYYTIGSGISDLYTAISHRLADRLIKLSRRYENTLPSLLQQAEDCEAVVKHHLERMGFTW
jgi:type I restriction enzyme M protein